MGSTPAKTYVDHTLKGQEIRTLLDGAQDTGYHNMQWAGKNTHGESMASAVYVVQLNAGEFVQSRKIVLVK